jgi:AcrR family transcriptional regulator
VAETLDEHADISSAASAERDTLSGVILRFVYGGSLRLASKRARQFPMRADAKRNYDLLVAAADAVFTEHGTEAPLEDIARKAGVGIGTLYRRFPTREALLAAVLDEGTQAIVERGQELLAAHSPSLGLAKWLEALVGYVMTYRGLTEAVVAGYKDSDEPFCRGCDAIAQTGAALVERAQAAGELRADASARDVVMAAHAAAWVGEQTKDPEAPARLLATLLAGLRGDGVRREPARRRTAR